MKKLKTNLPFTRGCYASRRLLMLNYCKKKSFGCLASQQNNVYKRYVLGVLAKDLYSMSISSKRTPIFLLYLCTLVFITGVTERLVFYPDHFYEFSYIQLFYAFILQIQAKELNETIF